MQKAIIYCEFDNAAANYRPANIDLKAVEFSLIKSFLDWVRDRNSHGKFEAVKHKETKEDRVREVVDIVQMKRDCYAIRE